MSYSGPASGLWTSPNPFSSVPAGSQAVADNVIFKAPSVIEPRRGFSEMADSSFGTGTSLADTFIYYGTAVLLAYDFTKLAFKGPDCPFLELFDDQVPNGANRIKLEQAARAVYLNPDDGIKVFDSPIPFAQYAAEPGLAIRGSAGTGTLAALATLTDTTSGAFGVSENGTSAAAAYLYLRDATTTGVFSGGDSLSGPPSYAATQFGDPLEALFLPLGAIVSVGQSITGVTSQAQGIITQITTTASYVAVALVGDTAPAFVTEVVVISDAPTTDTRYAGNPQGLNIVVANVSTNGWQEPNTASAYRFTICSKDRFGRVTEGPPSGRTVLKNLIEAQIGDLFRVGATVFFGSLQPHGLSPGDVVTLTPGEIAPGNAEFPPGPKTVVTTPDDFAFTYTEAGPAVSSTVVEQFQITRSANVTLYFDSTVSTLNFLRVYRSEPSATAATTPSDDLFQVYETPYLSTAELAAGFVTFNDVTPDSFLDLEDLGLYTNPNQGGGQLVANFQPPIAEDMAYWQDRMWYANSTNKQASFLTLVGVGAPDGIQAGDSLSFLFEGGVIPGDLVVFTAVAFPTVLAPLEFWVYDDADPGFNIQRTTQALCQAINISGASIDAFYISSETGTPGRMYIVRKVDGTSDPYQKTFTAYSSRATAWSPQLPNVPFPVPIPDFEPLVSNNNRHAARVWYSKLGQPEAVPLPNYEQVGADNFPIIRIYPLNYRLLVFKTNGLYFIPNTFPPTYQKISDHVLIGRDSIARLGNTVYCLTDQGIVSIGDSGVQPISIPIDDTLVALGGPSSLTNLQDRTTACAYQTERQYLCWLVERNDLNEITADNEQAFAYSSLSSGFTRYTFGVRSAVVDTNTNKLVVAPTTDHRLWVERKTLTDADYEDVGALPVECELKFNTLTEGEPATMKMAQQCTFLFKENGINEITTLFASEVHPSDIEVPLVTEGWGGFSWGEVPWGGWVRTIRRVQPLPVDVANCAQLSVGFSTAQVGRKFAFLGIVIETVDDTQANRG